MMESRGMKLLNAVLKRDNRRKTCTVSKTSKASEKNYIPHEKTAVNMILNDKTTEKPTDIHTTDENKTNESQTEERKNDDNKTEERKKEENKSEENRTDESNDDEMKTEENKTDENKTDEIKTDENKTDENKTGENKTEENKNDENKTEETKIDENKVDENKTEENKTDKSHSKESLNDEKKNEKNQTSERKNDENKSGESKIDESESKESKNDEKKNKEKKTDESKNYENKTEENKTEESKNYKNLTEGKNTDESKIKEYKIEENQNGESKTGESEHDENPTEEKNTDVSKTTESKFEEKKTEENQTDQSKTDKSKQIGGQKESPNKVECVKVKKTRGWKILSTNCLTKIKIASVDNCNDTYSSELSDLSPADDTDEDPDFNIQDEYGKRKKGFSLLDLNPRKKMKVHFDTNRPSTSSIHTENRNRPVEMFENNDEILTELEKTQTPKGKKRKARPGEWIKLKNKMLRNSGEQYTTLKNKKVKPAKSVQPPCGEKCKLKCKEKIQAENRLEIFKGFWELKDINRQRDFVSKCMQKVEPKYRYPLNTKQRRFNNAFYFTVGGQRVKVCKHFFIATLDINVRFVRTVVEKTEKSESGIVGSDLRGKHGHHKTVNPELKERVREHINSIPRIESHYLRKQTTREYIEGSKTLVDLYNDYKNSCVAENVIPVHQSMYSKIFNNEFNISFFQPKKDLCDLCEAYKNADEKSKLDLKLKYDTHLLEKDLSRKEKDRDKSMADEKLIVACYDLQATFPVPKGEVSLFYYKSKLNCMNFTITELMTKDVHCFTWHEGEGNRGVNEIGTCIWSFLKEKSKPFEDEGQAIDVIMYSDNCSGQQKNKFMISLYMYAVSVLNIESITHKFLIKGHTQNENDTAHSVIEKHAKRALKSGPVYDPSQYVSLIRSAKRTGKPFKVTEMSHSDFYDWKKLHNDCNTAATKTKTRGTNKKKSLKKNNALGFKSKKKGG